MHTNCIFQESWWLDTVAPGQWAEAVVEKGGQITARMPYVKKKRYGLTGITTPKLTPVLGPWIKPSTAKYAKCLRRQKDAIESLLEQLPSHSYCYIACHPSVTNLLPFYWAGFDLQLAYTYKILDLTDPDRIWSGFLENARTDIRKAQKRVAVRDDLGIDAFIKLLGDDLRTPRPKDAFFARACQADRGYHGRARATPNPLCRRRAGAGPCATYLIWDERCAYYLMGGGDPELRSSGATSPDDVGGNSARRDRVQGVRFRGFHGGTHRTFHSCFRSSTNTLLPRLLLAPLAEEPLGRKGCLSKAGRVTHSVSCRARFCGRSRSWRTKQWNNQGAELLSATDRSKN